MYKPGASSRKTFENIKTAKLWDKTQRIYEKYRKLWNGPAIPIFIFPLDETNVQLVRDGKGKSGVSFIDKLFLFLTSLEDEKELEALFVHEYHHVCRMNSQKKRVEDYALLDSIILEGLAEHAVADHCGEQYTGEWSKRYVKKDLSRHWSNDISEKLSIKRNHPLHDRILFGLGNRPTLLGYALGFEIIKQYRKHGKISVKNSFLIPSEDFIESFKFE